VRVSRGGKVRGLRRAALIVAISGAAGLGWAQEPAVSNPQQPAATQPPPAASNRPQAADGAVSATPASAQDFGTAPAGTSVTPKMFTVPAGTKVLLQLRSGINTKSARAGDGVYLASTFPVVVGTRVMIPAGVYVQGMIDRVERAGHVKGRSQLDMHFTSMIFPNGTVVEIPGMVNALPGAKKQSVKDDGEGTIEQAGDKGRNAGKVAEIGIPTGGTVGSIAGIDSGHPLAGGLAGIGAGLAAAGIVSLFTRGADVDIPNGSQVEMVLQRPLLLQEENLAVGANGGSPAGTALVPAANQPRPLDKPTIHRAQVICPPGGLGCQ